MNHPIVFSATDIQSLIERFEARTLPKSEWTHTAHLVVAIWYSTHFDALEALRLVRQNIMAYNQSIGTPNSDSEGYHETISRFWLSTARAFLNSQSFDSLAHSCNEFIHSTYSDRGYPLQFYSRELLFSVQARQRWVVPDIQELHLISNT